MRPITKRLLTTIILTIVALCCASTYCQAKERLPNARVISMFMRDKNADVNENYVVNFFIGEFCRFLESRRMKAVYSKSMDGVDGGWYAAIEFNGYTDLDWNGVYHYKYSDVRIFFFNPNNEDESYFVELGNFKVGTHPGELIQVFKNKF